MKKIFKKLLIAFVIIILLFGLFLAAWVYWLFPKFVESKDEAAEPVPGIVEIAEESETIDFEESKGMLYVNNEVIVCFKESATEKEISEFIDSLNADFDDSMADINVYRLLFKDKMSYSELKSLVEEIEDKSIVESAYLNTVTELEEDTVDEEDDFDYEDPVYPNDSWDDDEWSVDVPRGENWGMEAIDAPGAWGYLDQLSKVKIGLIDNMPNLSHEDLTFANSSCLFIDEETGLTNVNKYNLSAEDHGTHVSGTMNAKWNNEIGVSGVMGGKGELYYSAVYYDSDGEITGRYATAYSYLLALKTLIDQDVQVINISQNTSRLVGFAASHGNQNAINYLTAHAELTEKGLSRIISAREAENKPDFVICVAAGNSNNTEYYEDDDEPYGYREEMTDWECIKWIFGWRGEIGGSLALYNNFLSLMDEDAVKNRVVVVGAVGIDSDASTTNNTQYSYAEFSNVGSRVDIVAPGVDVYSCIEEGYESMSGTSMAAPHVSGVAGLVFAANTTLTGPEVKEILIASSTGRYYHGQEYSGLLNANAAVVNALKTEEKPVEKVLKKESDSGLDLCFIVDTTGSMGDDIENAKENMAEILEHLAIKTENYRVALIDYRDFPDRSYDDSDYPYKVQLRFTDKNSAIIDAINELDLGNGGDTEETVYSAMMAAVDLEWRTDSKKVIIILGDAAPLDPEPVTDYTYEDVLLALFNEDISIDYDGSDERVVSELDTNLINVFSIGTGASEDAADFFEEISSSTGGAYAEAEEASEVGDAIIESIEKIEIVEKTTVKADFGADMRNQKINLYSGKEYMFTLETDEEGKAVIGSMEADTYKWTSNGLYSGGTIEIEADNKNATIHKTKDYWFTSIIEKYHQNTLIMYFAVCAYLALCIIIPVLVKLIFGGKSEGESKKQSKKQSKEKSKKKSKKKTEGICPNCGSKTLEEDKFCKQCGHGLQK